MRVVRWLALLLLVVCGRWVSFAQVQLGTEPEYVFGTYLGGSSNDDVTDIAVGRDGSIYLLGITYSSNFPVSPDALQKTNRYAPDFSKVFVTKLTADGTKIIYSTLLGSSYENYPAGIIVLDNGEVYVAGTTSDNLGDFPTTAGAFQTTPVEGYQDFIVRLDATGSKLLYSTLLGGSQSGENENACGLGMDQDGNIYVAGSTTALDFPVTANAIQMSHTAPAQYPNLFLAKFDPTLSKLLFSTYLGGSSSDNCLSFSLAKSGLAYLAGTTGSADFPVTATALQSTSATRFTTSFVSVIDSSKPNLMYSSYLGGSYTDSILGLALGDDGSVYLTGQAQSLDFPVTSNAFQTSLGSPLYNDGFVTRINPTLSGTSSLEYSTFLATGGFGQALIVDSAGNTYVTGASGSGFLTPNAFQSSARDGFIAVLNPSGTGLLYGTYFGGSLVSYGPGGGGHAIVLDTQGNIYYGGRTYSPDFPVMPGVVQPVCGDHENCASQTSDGVLGKFATQYADLQIGMAVDSVSININEPFSWHITVINKGPSVANNVIVANSSPSTIQQMSAQPGQGTCSGSAPLACNLGTLSSGQSATVNFSAIPVATGLVSTVAAVSAATYDPDESNNRASIQMNILGPADFSISATPQTRTIAIGGIATFQIGGSPQNGFKQTINLACSGLPTGAKCQFLPASLNPAAGLASSTLSISFPSSSAELTQSPRYPYSAAIFFLPLLGVFRKKSLLSVLSLLILFAGCGGSMQTKNIQVVDAVQSHQVVVIATSGTLQHSMNLTVVAQQ